ncbi:hypothetical protein HK098_005565 [Nowakowskiella sp. JEL0407]|nr:hypothetical protein HK098_005565 [Nowakowskiella sp. JEL0407]
MSQPPPGQYGYAPPPQGYPQGYPQQPGYPSPQGGYQQQFAPPPVPSGHPQQQAPPQQQLPPPQGGITQQASFVTADNSRNISGSIDGVHYDILYRDTNAMVKVMLPHRQMVYCKPGAMVGMSPTIKLQGKMKKFGMAMLTGDFIMQTLTAEAGPGEVLIAPPCFGDIIPITLDGRTEWVVPRDGYLCMTSGVVKQTKTQGFGAAMFSGEGLFVNRFSGRGVLFVQSIGAIHPIDLGPGQDYIIDNGHLVAWAATTQYSIERAGGFMASMSTGEGLVCRFKGPGRVYLQTRNPEGIAQWIMANSAGGKSGGGGGSGLVGALLS